MHRPDLRHQILPLSYQGGDLLRFHRVSMGNIHQDSELGIHHAKIGVEFHACRDHAGIDGQGLAGLDDAGVGFFGGHGGSISAGGAPW